MIENQKIFFITLPPLMIYVDIVALFFKNMNTAHVTIYFYHSLPDRPASQSESGENSVVLSHRDE
jgi:hypothetical protein